MRRFPRKKHVCRAALILVADIAAFGASMVFIPGRYVSAWAPVQLAACRSSRANMSSRDCTGHLRSSYNERRRGMNLMDGRKMTVDSSDTAGDAAMTSVETTQSFDDMKNRNNINDQVMSAISSCGGIKVTVATTRNLVNEFMQMHTMAEVPADAIGRLSTSALLMSNGMQDEQTVQLSIAGDGPLRGAVAISTGKGEVRGYVGNPALNGFTLQEAVGQGTVQVVKNHPEWPNPYNGITSIRNGDIDRDVGIYLAESEQRSCALAAATSVSGVLCKAAGGYMVEQLPDCTPETKRIVEQNLQELVTMDGGDKIPTNLLISGITPVEIAGTILKGLDMEPLQNLTPTYRCNCSPERLFRSLRLLPREEVDEIVAEQDQIEARCQFCGRVYRMGPEEIERRFANAKGDPTKDDGVDA